MTQIANTFVKPHAFSVVVRDDCGKYLATTLGPIELQRGDLILNWIERTGTLGVHEVHSTHVELVGGVRPGARRKLTAFASAAVLDVLESFAASGLPVHRALDAARQLETSLSARSERDRRASGATLPRLAANPLSGRASSHRAVL